MKLTTLQQHNKKTEENNTSVSNQCCLSRWIEKELNDVSWKNKISLFINGFLFYFYMLQVVRFNF